MEKNYVLKFLRTYKKRIVMEDLMSYDKKVVELFDKFSFSIQKI